MAITPLIELYMSTIKDNREINIVDIGAAEFDTTKNNYNSIINSYPFKIYGFEPNPDEFEKLKKNKDPKVTYLPYAIGDGGIHKLSICQIPGCSSLLTPNLEEMSKYKFFSEWMLVVDKHMVKTKRLDDIDDIKYIDLFKIDIQGCEYLALSNSLEKLKSTLVIECEVEFVEQYIGQPRFSEIEILLRSQGFHFVKFMGYGTRPLDPMIINENPFIYGNQWLWSDALFIRNINEWDSMSNEELCTLAIILAESYEMYDFSYKAISILDHRNNTEYSDIFLRWLNENFTDKFEINSNDYSHLIFSGNQD
ncbi:FkbM family methyltransferase [Xenorhabdus bovienii]|uniref:FkbM family methyltransferase n=1 Tax=Xenorhabdus bovienii TaxID=40576 RepID=UPI003DA51665